MEGIIWSISIDLFQRIERLFSSNLCASRIAREVLYRARST